MAEDTRIEQFKRMTAADPENELGHFSLGRACFDAGQFDDSIEPLSRALELNPNLSSVYQRLGEAYDKTGRRDKAIETMTQGVTVADRQGDRMPRDAMAELLRQWGAPIPGFLEREVSAAPAQPGEPRTGEFRCVRCGRPGGPLPKAPFRGALGEKVLGHICTLCWREWIETGTKVINELGLTLSTKAGQDAYDQYMVEFLELDRV